MKALTLTQPWATLVMYGYKKIETRSWATKYRGPIAIHAAKGFPPAAHDLWDNPNFPAFRQVLVTRLSYYPEDMPLGAILGTVELVRCGPIASWADGIDHHLRPGAWLGESHWRAGDFVPPLRESFEYQFGGWGPGRFAWELADIVRYDKPEPARGALGLWEWSPIQLDNLPA